MSRDGSGCNIFFFFFMAFVDQSSRWAQRSWFFFFWTELRPDGGSDHIDAFNVREVRARAQGHAVLLCSDQWRERERERKSQASEIIQSAVMSGCDQALIMTRDQGCDQHTHLITFLFWDLLGSEQTTFCCVTGSCSLFILCCSSFWRTLCNYCALFMLQAILSCTALLGRM